MRCRLCLLAAVLLAAPAGADAPKRSHDVTLDDYFTLDAIAQQQISPDGRRVAYTAARWDKANDGRRVDLWVVEGEPAKSRRLTFDHTGVASPRWSPDGRHVYFLAGLKREGEKKPPLDGAAQVWRVGPGGDPFAVT